MPSLGDLATSVIMLPFGNIKNQGLMIIEMIILFMRGSCDIDNCNSGK